MALDIKKCFKAALLPAAMIIVIAVILQLVVNFIPTFPCALGLPAFDGSWILIDPVILQLAVNFLPTAACFVCLPGLVINLVILAWAGYQVVKEQGMALSGGVVTGAIAGVIAILVNGIVSLMLFVLGIGVYADAINRFIGPGSSSGAALPSMLENVPIGLMLAIVFGAIAGAVCGAVGVYIASRKTKPKK